MRVFAHASLVLLLAGTSGAQQLAWLEDARVVVLAEERIVPWPGTEGAESFCWDRASRSVLVTRTDRLQRIAPDGRRTTLVHAFEQVRFPDVCAATGRIAFACRLAGSKPDEWQVRVVEGDGRGNLELGAGYDPVFLPDGTGVVFECFEDPGPDIWVYTFESRTRRRLFTEHAPRYTPAVTHDGKRIAFTSSGRLMMANMAGDGVIDLSPKGVTYDRFANFAPDDGSIAFFRERDGKTAIVVRALAGEERVLPAGPRATLPQFQPARTQPVVRSLTPEEATALVSAVKRSALVLPDLSQLTPEVARELAKAEGSLVLDGVDRLDVRTAEALAHWDGSGECVFLALDGLHEPAPEAVAALAHSLGWGLSLGSITELTPAYLSALARFRGARVRLHGLVEFGEAEAKVVAAMWQAKWIEVDFETRVSKAARTALAAGRTELLGGSP